MPPVTVVVAEPVLWPKQPTFAEAEKKTVSAVEVVMVICTVSVQPLVSVTVTV